MKNRRLILVTAIGVFALLTGSTSLAAQDATAPAKKAQHHHYKLLVMGTFGGPGSYFADYPGNTKGMLSAPLVTGLADTPTPDPYAPNFPWSDGYVAHTFERRDGAFKDLGALPGFGNSSASTWINARGLIAGISENGQIDPLYTGMPEVRAVIWENGKIKDLGTLEGGNESAAYAISNRGQVVGTSTNLVPDANSMARNTFWLWGDGIAAYPYQVRSFLWDRHAGMQDLGTLGTGTDAQALFINDAGQVAGISYVNSDPGACVFGITTHSFIWNKEDGMTDLGSLGGTCTLASDLNSKGQVVGEAWATGDNEIRPFLWDNGSLQDLGGTLGGSEVDALAINQRGEAAGKANLPGDATSHAVLWRQVGDFTDLGTVGNDPCAFAWAINDAEQVVGLSSPSDCAMYNVSRPFLWENNSMVDLNSLIPPNSPLKLVYAFAINDRGEIPGNGIDANGNVRAFLLIPCDENHADLEDCDYSLVETSGTAAASSTPASTAMLASLANQDNPAFVGAADTMLRRFGRRPSLWHRWPVPQAPREEVKQ